MNLLSTCYERRAIYSEGKKWPLTITSTCTEKLTEMAYRLKKLYKIIRRKHRKSLQPTR